MDKPSALTRREQADAGALHILKCASGTAECGECGKYVEGAGCSECVEGGQALAAAWPVRVYQLSDRDVENVYLVRAFNEDAAWAWLAKNDGLRIDQVKKGYEISEAVINEAP